MKKRCYTMTGRGSENENEGKKRVSAYQRKFHNKKSPDVVHSCRVGKHEVQLMGGAGLEASKFIRPKAILAKNMLVRSERHLSAYKAIEPWSWTWTWQWPYQLAKTPKKKSVETPDTEV